jgi:hypothetical protein
VKTLLLAEWSLSISKPTALPHLLSVLLQSIDPIPEGNIRTVLPPAAYTDAARQAGWELVGNRTFTPVNGLQDGRWEIQFARQVAATADFEKQLAGQSERNTETIRLESIRAHAGAFETSLVATAGQGEVECMDVWTAVFRPA